MTPLPPLPASAIERLDCATRDGARRGLSPAPVLVSTPMLGSRFMLQQVNRLSAGFDLMQIKASAISLLHHTA
jgi:hypothetical protein